MDIESKYVRASFEPLARQVYGVGCHWTTWTLAKNGEAVSFAKAVEKFDVNAFAQQVEETGAGHVLFTMNHALHWLPCPSGETDKRLGGRTCERDLPADLMKALKKRGVATSLYYHHGCDGGTQDPEWQRAAGGYDATRDRLQGMMCDVLSELGERYGKDVQAWWFDAGWQITHGNSAGWERVIMAGKAGNADRLVTFNGGLDTQLVLTELQDYWPGEMEGIEYGPTGKRAPFGLPWYSFRTWQRGRDTATWGMDEVGVKRQRLLPSVEQVVDTIESYRRVGGAITFNMLVWQSGEFLETEMELMRGVRRARAL